MTQGDPQAEPAEADRDSAGLDPLSVGRAIKSLRRRQRITMVELGKKAGISQSYLSEIETGKSAPSLSTLFAIAEQLGTTPAGLLRPSSYDEEVAVVRAESGEIHPITAGPDGGHFRAILSSGSLSFCEFVASPGDDLAEDFSHSGHEFIHIAQGSLVVTLRGREPMLLAAGDTMSYPGEWPHSWELAGTETIRVFQVLDTPGFPQFHQPIRRA